MKYELPNDAAGYLPEVIAKLRCLNADTVNDHGLQLSHPADIFMLTFRDAVESLHDLARSVNQSTEIVMNGGVLDASRLPEMRRQVFNLLFYTGNFVEGCQSIIKSLFPAGDKRLTKASRSFKDSVEGYTSHASQLINKVKHQHRRPRIFTFSGEGSIIFGYYLEGLVEKGVLGPDSELHRRYKGMRTGFSLNRMIPYHLCNLYFVSSCLATLIDEHGDFEFSSAAKIDDEFCREIIAEVEKVRCMLLPDEMKAKLPVVMRKADDRFVLALPGKRKILNAKPYVANVNLEFRVGVVDRGIALPYLLPKT